MGDAVRIEVIKLTGRWTVVYRDRKGPFSVRLDARTERAAVREAAALMEVPESEIEVRYK